jgi:hypothetical protein
MTLIVLFLYGIAELCAYLDNRMIDKRDKS